MEHVVGDGAAASGENDRQESREVPQCEQESPYDGRANQVRRSNTPWTTGTGTAHTEQGPPVDVGDVHDVSNETIGTGATATRTASATPW